MLNILRNHFYLLFHLGWLLKSSVILFLAFKFMIFIAIGLLRFFHFKHFYGLNKSILVLLNKGSILFPNYIQLYYLNIIIFRIFILFSNFLFVLLLIRVLILFNIKIMNRHIKNTHSGGMNTFDFRMFFIAVG